MNPRTVQVERRFRLARAWSNTRLRAAAGLCRGAVANVSAGDDLDKEGGRYRDYFDAADSYTLTNHPDPLYRGFQDGPGEVPLDLREPPPEELRGRFDAVFNHTTLEHVYEVQAAVDTLCALTRDLLIVVVPFAQVHHENAGYEDFWRFTPTGLRRMLSERGLQTLNLEFNRDQNAATYLFAVASREPTRWIGRFGPPPAAYADAKIADQAAGSLGAEPLAWPDFWRVVRGRLLPARAARRA